MEASGHIAETGGAAGQTPTLIQRVVMIFVSPVKLGESIRQNSPWFWTLLIVAIVGLIAMLFIPMEVWVQMMQQQARQTEGAPDPETAARITRIVGTVAVVVMTFVGAAIAAGVLYLAFNVVLGQDLTYKQHLSAVSHVYWIATLGMLLTVPVWIAQADLRAALGLGLLLPDAPATFFEHFLNGITLFGLWGTAALGAAESGLSGGRVSTGKAIGTTMALYLILALFKGLQGTLSAG